MKNGRFELISEFLAELYMNEDIDIKCAEITISMPNKRDQQYLLKENHTEIEYEEFLSHLDFKYDPDSGHQYIYGTIWLTNTDKWIERREYDGQEYWKLMGTPTIPEVLRS